MTRSRIEGAFTAHRKVARRAPAGLQTSRNRAFKSTWVCLALLVIACTTLDAQAPDTLIVLGNDNTSAGQKIIRFDRKLGLIGQVDVTGGGFDDFTQVAIDGEGRRWINFDALSATQLLRLSKEGQLLPSVMVGPYNPVAVGVGGNGCTYALTRIPLLTPGPLDAINPDGSILWSNSAATTLPQWIAYPRQVTVTSGGSLWIGDGATLFGVETQPWIVRVDPSNGSVMKTLELPSLVNPHSGSAGVNQLVGSIDGTLWALVSGGGDMLVNTDGQKIVQAFAIQGGHEGNTYHLRVDATGRLLVVNYWQFGGPSNGDTLLRFDPAAPSAPESSFPMGGLLNGFALGPTGEDAFAVISILDAPGPPYPLRLVRMNLVTGVKSSVPLSPTWFDCRIAYGDQTGFIWANAIDRLGDADGDGAPNGVETAAGSNPFDATSRPNGPKVYIKFLPVTNALALTFEDPDGLIDPQGGLDVSTLSLSIGHYTNVFNYLLPFVTGLDVSPDFKQATLTFGGLPLPSDKKWQVEVHVSDMTGAVGWDWQVTPPGDL